MTEGRREVRKQVGAHSWPQPGPRVPDLFPQRTWLTNPRRIVENQFLAPRNQLNVRAGLVQQAGKLDGRSATAYHDDVAAAECFKVVVLVTMGDVFRAKLFEQRGDVLEMGDSDRKHQPLRLDFFAILKR